MGENILKLIKPADIITLINALLGFASIIMIIRGVIYEALVFILFAVIADSIDGTLRRHSGQNILGEDLDSLADVISFGVVPALVAYVFLNNLGFAEIFAGLFLVCGMLRLAKFNVTGNKDGFEGVPITASGFIVALFFLFKEEVPYFEHLLIFLLILLSLLMVSTINYPKYKSPTVLTPMTALLVFDIIFFIRGYSDMVEIISFILFAFIAAYILSPLGTRNGFYDSGA